MKRLSFCTRFATSGNTNFVASWLPLRHRRSWSLSGKSSRARSMRSRSQSRLCAERGTKPMLQRRAELIAKLKDTRAKLVLLVAQADNAIWLAEHLSSEVELTNEDPDWGRDERTSENWE